MNIDGFNFILFESNVTSWDIEKVLSNQGIKRKPIEWDFNKTLSFNPLKYILINWRFYLRRISDISFTEEELINNNNPLYFFNKVLTYRWMGYLIEDICLYSPIVNSHIKFAQYYDQYNPIISTNLLSPHLDAFLLRRLLFYVLNNYDCKIIYFLDHFFNYIEHDVKKGDISSIAIMNSPFNTCIINQDVMITLCNSAYTTTLYCNLYISEYTDINSLLNESINKEGLIIFIKDIY